MGLDAGEARIGIAVCDPLQVGARPLSTLHRRSRREDFDRLAQLVTEHEIKAIICGLPLNMDGSEGPQAATTRKWALRLAQALRAILGVSLPIIFWDERLSTFVAQETIRAQNLRVEEDAAAAAVILQSYLDHLRRIADSPTQQPEKRTEYDSIVLPALAPQR